MAYKNNPLFPVNPEEAIPVNDSQVRNLDNQKIIDRLQAIENEISNLPGTQARQPLPEIEEINLTTGVTNLENFTADFFSIDNQQEGDTGEILIEINTPAAGTQNITIKPGVIYNSPQFPGFFYDLVQAENTGGDSKKIVLYKTAP